MVSTTLSSLLCHLRPNFFKEHSQKLRYYCLGWTERRQSHSLDSGRQEQVCAVKVSSEEVGRCSVRTRTHFRDLSVQPLQVVEYGRVSRPSPQIQKCATTARHPTHVRYRVGERSDRSGVRLRKPFGGGGGGGDISNADAKRIGSPNEIRRGSCASFSCCISARLFHRFMLPRRPPIVQVVTVVDTRQATPRSSERKGRGSAALRITLGAVGEPQDLDMFMLNAAEWPGPKVIRSPRIRLLGSACFHRSTTTVFGRPGGKQAQSIFCRNILFRVGEGSLSPRLMMGHVDVHVRLQAGTQSDGW